MVKNILLLIPLLFLNNVVQGQLEDSTVRKYLVCRKKDSYLDKIVILNEGKTLIIKELNTGIRRSGLLKVVNDSTISITNRYTGIIDTFKLKNIQKIRHPSILRSFKSGFGIFFGAICYFTGFAVIQDGTYPKLGYYIIGLGVLCQTSGIVRLNGPTYWFYKYDYKTITTKGFKLKRRDVPSLWN